MGVGVPRLKSHAFSRRRSRSRRIAHEGLPGLLGPRQGARGSTTSTSSDPQGRGLRLLGPNGSGKSTTIKLLLGLIFPTAGNAWVMGEPAGSTRVNEKVGFLPEESYLYRFLNGEETLKFYGRLFKIPSRELKRRVPRLLDVVGLDAKARKRSSASIRGGHGPPHRPGAALINNPDLILLDEPTTGLDPIGTREMKDLIVSLKEQGKTVLLCSHLLADVQDVCDRIDHVRRQDDGAGEGRPGRGAWPARAPGEGRHADQRKLDPRPSTDRGTAAVPHPHGRQRRSGHAPDHDARGPVHAGHRRERPHRRR